MKCALIFQTGKMTQVWQRFGKAKMFWENHWHYTILYTLILHWDWLAPDWLIYLQKLFVFSIQFTKWLHLHAFVGRFNSNWNIHMYCRGETFHQSFEGWGTWGKGPREGVFHYSGFQLSNVKLMWHDRVEDK